ncbi:hypothetical protein E2493_14235 [Sphingomonas parva]|uniref:EF-hand domain-containing protein n=1 Tax=Sphingomonas parva TaxID=2555898 RepID=A0A4Y8ZPY7_9SPHN|nr:hypothetical protein [Sphingomonas parva]TFI57527.1 hypothetical protein E2493_14235 [Sphingomonas parva]
MNRHLLGFSTIALAAAVPAAAQQPSGALQPQTRTVINPVAPPGLVTTRVGPGTWVVTPVPGLAMATQVRIQNFADYDLNHDGAYSPMEFAQAIYFVATSDPVAGNPKLPAADKYIQRGAPQPMMPATAVALLNSTADEFAAVDANNDWRITPQELDGTVVG